MNATVSVDIQVASTVNSIPEESVMQSWVQAVVGELEVGRECEVSIRIVDEQEARYQGNLLVGGQAE